MSLQYRFRDAVAEFKRLQDLREQAGMPPFWSSVNVDADPYRFNDDHLRDLIAQLDADIAGSRDGYNEHMRSVNRDGEQRGSPVGDSRQAFSLLMFGAAALGLVVLTKMRMF